MKYSIKLLFATLALGLTLSSCSKEDGLTEEEVQALIDKSQESADFLIGTWTSPNRYGFTFKEDGTGQWWNIYGAQAKQNMTWAYKNGILAIYMNMEGEGWNMFTVTQLSATEIVIGQGTRTAVYTKSE